MVWSSIFFRKVPTSSTVATIQTYVWSIVVLLVSEEIGFLLSSRDKHVLIGTIVIPTPLEYISIDVKKTKSIGFFLTDWACSGVLIYPALL